ncbi:TetR/AcrR family transcriptional regulator [Rhodoferax sp.]|uniref:TetR/AcrR family transcriptional regulator n=1 Tax=Rhodoferax sp. TaxID=50421 RepID=UPI002850E6B8|nr:TetR/AcrR family transcriptional regulator [Rhodoferax sp.]MDR3368744.1 TetR/AcrR family transcriptional regulator [Rhodoferax sp.]
MEIIDKPSKQRTEVRQASLVEAALRLAADRSPADITTGDLAQAVGITQGAVFRHFANKEAIWLAALDWTTTTLMGRLQEVAAKAGEPAAQNATPDVAAQAPSLRALQAVFMAHVAFVVDYPGVPRVIFQELQQPQDTALKARVRQLMQQYRALLMRLLLQAQQEHLIAAEADLTGASVLFIGSIQGLVMQALISGDVAAMTRLAPGVFAIYQRGLCADVAATFEGTP